MRKEKKFEDKEQFDINKVEFKPIGFSHISQYPLHL